MLKTFVISIRSTLILTALTGLFYPLLITLVGQALFPHAANGSLIKIGDKIVGSSLIAQKFASERYFQPRPSAGDFATVPSGASNLGPTSSALKDAVTERQKQWGKDAPSDLLTTSGSGLDPHITPKAAYLQVERVVRARGLNSDQQAKLKTLIDSHRVRPILGFIGRPTVNVLELNLDLDKAL